MADIDPDADIELRPGDEAVIVGIPVTGEMTPGWLGRYRRLAHAAGIPAYAEAHAGRSVIVVRLPLRSSHREIAKTMDAARALIPVANAAQRERQLEVDAET